MSLQMVIISFLIILAAGGITVALMAVWRHYLAQPRRDADPQRPKVYVLGTFSPILTWSKYGWPQFRNKLSWQALSPLWAAFLAHLPTVRSSTPNATASAPPDAPPLPVREPGPAEITAGPAQSKRESETKAPSSASGESQVRQVETHWVSEAPPPAGEPAPAAAQVRIVHVQVGLDLPEGWSVRVTVETAPGAAPVVFSTPLEASAANPRTSTLQPAPVAQAGLIHDLKGRWTLGQAALGRLRAAWQRRPLSAGVLLFGLSLVIYLVMHLWALDAFPIYFFSDEANEAMMAQNLMAHGFRSPDGILFPVYFEAAGLRDTPMVGVYLHALAITLFGKSIFVVRGISALVSVLAAVAVALCLKWVFKARYWWAGVLVLAITPAWFLHSRTAFETAFMTTFFACFLLFYLLYRVRSPRFIFAAVAFGAATFYSYSNAQLVMAMAALLLFISDLPYHWQQRRFVLMGLLFAGVLAVPLIIFQLKDPAALGTHLRAVDSYFFKPIPLSEKISMYVQKYAFGLSPQYWFWPNEVDLVRHRMQGMGNILIEVAPLALLGLVICLAKYRSSPYRAVILAALAAPAGAALLDVSITRVLTFVVPAAILTVLGLEWLLILLKRVSARVLAGGVFVVLAAVSLWMLRTALVDGPLWYRDYGLYGMQYGAKQLFVDTIPQYLAREPNTQIDISSTWANGTDVYLGFFLTPAQQARVQMQNVDYYMFQRRDLTPNNLLVMTPNELATAQGSPKFKSVTVEKTIPYPDGNPGFYFARLAYADNVDAIFQDEAAERRKPVTDTLQLWGQKVAISHSPFGSGQLSDVFDGDTFTLVRGLEANPLVFDFAFSQPIPITHLAADFGTMDNFTLSVMLYAPGASDPVVTAHTYTGLPADPHVDLPLPGAPPLAGRMRVEILNNLSGVTAETHVRELSIK